MESDKAGRDLCSLLLGYYDGIKLKFACRVGTGVTIASGRDLALRST